MSEELINSSDNFFYINAQPITLHDVMEGVDDICKQIDATGDFEYGVTAIRSMATAGRIMGISLARLLHGMNNIWYAKGYEDDLYDYLAASISIKRITFDRYIKAWDAVLQAPAQYQEALMVRPMKDLNALGAAVSQGYEIEDKDWDELIDAENNADFLKVLREEVKGKETKTNTMTMYLDQNTGDIELWLNGVKKSLGYLNVQDADNDAAIAKAINRIVDNSHIVLR